LKRNGIQIGGEDIEYEVEKKNLMMTQFHVFLFGNGLHRVQFETIQVMNKT
jgi:hypothetical protein